MKRACEERNVALADGTYAASKKRTKLCADHGIQCKRDMWKDSEAAARVARSELAQRLQALQPQKSPLGRYFARKPGAADIPVAPEAVGSSVAIDVATAPLGRHFAGSPVAPLLRRPSAPQTSPSHPAPRAWQLPGR